MYKSLKVNDNESISICEDSTRSNKRCILYLNNMYSGVLHSISVRLNSEQVDSLIDMLSKYSSKARGDLNC